MPSILSTIPRHANRCLWLSLGKEFRDQSAGFFPLRRSTPLLGTFTLFISLLFGFSSSRADEGMFPISELGGLELQSKGLRLTTAEIFDPNGVSLVDGICRVNGCTGSFVSPQGLIITNHHCAYRAIQSASTPETDYLKDGFVAKTTSEEVPATGYTVRITEAYVDVSAAVLSAVNPEMTFLERAKAIEKQRKEIERKSEDENPGLRAEVAEMFTGKTYGLFLYTYLKDVRLVFAPPHAVGVFGGAVDNWEWPRHTGDFSMMRAYVAPDGSSAEYSPDNVPYQPKRFLQVAPHGVSEEDYVMLLGYPGRTARHKTSHFLAYERDIRLPYVVDLYQWEIGVMEEAGKENREVALKHTSRIQSLANVEKRSRGQLKGLRRAQIVEARIEEEKKLQAFIGSDPKRSAQYGSLLDRLATFYAELSGVAPRELEEQALTSTCRTLAIAFTLYDASVQRTKYDLERESAYMDRNFDQTVKQILLSQKDLDPNTDRLMFAEVLRRLAQYMDSQTLAPLPKDRTTPIENQISQSQIDSAVELLATSKISDPKFIEACLGWSTRELEESEDPALKIIALWYPRLMELREAEKERDGQLGQLYGDLQTVKNDFLATRFVPDANATLRLTYGYVRGYSPEDAVYKLPFTTLRGLIDKTTGIEPFITPKAVLDRYSAKDFGTFVHPDLREVPVAMLYSTDTTGGNSGSPILNADGQLVGVNFDRTFEATINDFAWNENYSRSIGVDIRYVLWLTGKVFGAKHLIEEMGIDDGN